MPNKNKTLVITGASKGIGRAVAKLFSEKGFKVVNLSRSVCDLDGVVNVAVDLANHEWASKARDELLQQIGTPNQMVIVHNAAMMTKDTVSDIGAESLRQVLEINVVAAAALNTMLIPELKSGSSIVYISSTLGTKAVANTYAYSISKHAVIGQMRATCQDLAGSKLHTACICPGFTETKMLQDHLGQNPEIYQQITAGVALKRLVQPSEIADTVWFCSQNPVVNGAVLHANLGQIEH